MTKQYCYTSFPRLPGHVLAEGQTHTYTCPPRRLCLSPRSTRFHLHPGCTNDLWVKQDIFYMLIHWDFEGVSNTVPNLAVD